MYSLAGKRVFLTGGGGFVGRFVRPLLEQRGAIVAAPSSAECDLTRDVEVERAYREIKPQLVVHLAAEVGGIRANQDHPGRFFYANMAMGLHLVEHARRNGVEKLVQVGTICAYPKLTPVPFREADLWNGYPEETNAPYGIAKKALLVMLQGYRKEYGFNGVFLLPVNLYGPGDNFHPQTSHVIPALVRKLVASLDAGAPSVEVWGTGTATREFLYVEDFARAVIAAAERLETPEPVNIGAGREISIADLARLIASVVGYAGTLRFNPSYPDGQPRRCLDVTRAAELMGFRAEVALEEGIRRTVAWYREQKESGTVREVVY